MTTPTQKPLSEIAAEKCIESTYLLYGVRISNSFLEPIIRSVYAEQEARFANKEWRCFHCDDVFTDARLAWEHFGDDSLCSCDVPGCVDPLRTDEKARLKELREAVEHAMKMQRESEEADEKVSLLEHYREEIGRLFGDVGGVKASTPHQAWLVLDYKQGEVIALQARLAKALEALRYLAEAIDGVVEQRTYHTQTVICKYCKEATDKLATTKAAAIRELEGK